MAANLFIIHRESVSVERRVKGAMYYHRAPEMNSEERSGAKRAVVESAEALVVETVKRLARSCPQPQRSRLKPPPVSHGLMPKSPLGTIIKRRRVRRCGVFDQWA
jgi:hypothetical protein